MSKEQREYMDPVPYWEDEEKPKPARQAAPKGSANADADPKYLAPVDYWRTENEKPKPSTAPARQANGSARKADNGPRYMDPPAPYYLKNEKPEADAGEAEPCCEDCGGKVAEEEPASNAGMATNGAPWVEYPARPGEKTLPVIAFHGSN